jgi:predicted secreted hydrolase
MSSLNPLTLQGIAQALWMKDYDRSRIPAAILEKIESEKNSEQAYAQRFLQRLDQLAANQQSFVPPRPDRYALLRSHVATTGRMTPREFYTACLFLGPESNVGYEPIPLNPDLTLPAVDLPQLGKQLGWHFFVGNFTDANGAHFSVEMMFWQYTLLPPPLAAQLGLSAIENQSLEMHLAICDPQAGVQYRANTVIAAGTTGLVDIKPQPFTYRLGLNSIEGESTDGSLFPVRLRGRGWDMGKSPDVEIQVDLSLENKHGYFKQGDGGCSPSVDGLGTLYYSASQLNLHAGRESSITIAGRKLVLTGGRMWYDHQWTTGFMPNGAAQHAVMRAANNLSTPPPGGWDWFEFQFHPNPAIVPHGEVQMTFAALHSNANLSFYGQTGPTPPPTMTATFNGKYIAPNLTADLAGPWAKVVTQDISGTMKVSEWVKVTASPNPAIFPPTNTWYPARYEFTIDQPLPALVRQFALQPLIASGQTGFFATGLQYTEGGAVLLDFAGNEIGRGFAEGTAWAHTPATVLTLAGLPVNPQTLALLTPVAPSAWLKLLSYLYTIIDGAELKKILSEAKGL